MAVDGMSLPAARTQALLEPAARLRKKVKLFIGGGSTKNTVAMREPAEAFDDVLVANGKLVRLLHKPVFRRAASSR